MQRVQSDKGVVCGFCRPAAKWMFAADAAQRHDASHLLSHHIQMPLPALATLVSQVTHARNSS